MVKPLSLYCSFSHKDEDLLHDLEMHLALPRRLGLIELWHERKLTAGDGWKSEIDEQLERADMILLLVSPYYLASDYCYSLEMVRAMERHAKGEARVLAIIGRPSYWHLAPFSKLTVLPKDGKPVTTWKDPHEGWVDVIHGIIRAVDKINSLRR